MALLRAPCGIAMQRHATPHGRPCASARGCVAAGASVRCSWAHVRSPSPSASPAQHTRGGSDTVLYCATRWECCDRGSGCTGSAGGSRSGARPSTGVLSPRRAASLRCRCTPGAGEDLPEADQRISVKLGLAKSTGRLDLTDMRLGHVPAEVFEIEDLEDLILVGNNLSSLPESIGRLTRLRRLQLAGNELTTLPDALCRLTELEGLWLGGNQLVVLPQDIGQLASLRTLAASGNALTVLPESIGLLTQLEELDAAGNALESLPASMWGMSGLKRLSLHGNRLTELPGGDMSGVARLEELWLMGNRLTSLPAGLAQLIGLVKLGLHDNAITALPDGLQHLPRLIKLFAYGNQLSGPAAIGCLLSPPLSGDGGSSKTWPALDAMWLEGNPLVPEAVAGLLSAASDKSRLPALRDMGLDLGQLRGADAGLVRGAAKYLRVGELLGSGPGYFKLAPAPALAVEPQPPQVQPPPRPGTSAFMEAAGAAAAAAVAVASDAAVAAVASGRIVQQPLLVVSFGSAPGIPNWGGLTRALYTSPLLPATEGAGVNGVNSVDDGGVEGVDPSRQFDVLFVVDSERGWYRGGDASDEGVAYYAERLRQYTSRYARVLMLGDSMGATAALLFSDQATAVLSFCPQVDLTEASIRPGAGEEWRRSMKEAVLSAVTRSGAEITLCSGTWQHDLDQLNLLPQDNINVKVWSHDSHRLALYLSKAGKLTPLVRDAVLHQRSLRSGNVRLSNMV
ncbi:hypothetical protein FOA52_014998 [Chlamydomonas sp. UWO 241]|nr:hypothetical protein FOA52_014998 [Chlamydomonas sp. UWO 241]